MKQTWLALAVVAFAGLGVLPSQSNTLIASGDSTSGGSPPKLGFGFSIYDKPRPMPGFKFMDEDGHVLTLANFHGKLVLLNIWATWCPPCREEMPALDRLQATLGGPDFEVVALSIDQDGVALVKDFYRELGIEALRIYIKPSDRPPPELNVLGLPTTLLIDRQGMEIGWTQGPAEWNTPEVEAFIRWYMTHSDAK